MEFLKLSQTLVKKIYIMIKVSIIMPNYNAGRFITDSIESVLEQTYQNWELIICDDGSSDDSLEIIANYKIKDSRIKLVRNKYSKGASGARNSCLDHANGDFIAFLDSDDLWLPFKLEEQINFMLKERIVFSYSYNEVVSEDGRFVAFYKAPNKVNKKNMSYANFISCTTAIYRSSSIGKVYQPNITKRNDFALWLTILNSKDCNEAVCYPKVTSIYRSNTYGLSSKPYESIKYFYKCLINYNGKGYISALYYSLIYLLIIFFKKKMTFLYNQFVVKVF